MKKAKRRLSFRFIATIAVFALVLVLVFLSPLFRIDQVHVEGNVIIDRREIINAAHVEIGSSIFAFNGRRMAQRVDDALPYALYVGVERQLPRRVVLRVIERQPAINIHLNSGQYALIDNTGMVLEIAQNPKANLPKFTGLLVETLSVGQHLQTTPEDEGILANILQLNTLFVLYAFDAQVVEFDNPLDIIIHHGSFEISFGSMYEAERKIRYILGVLADAPMDRGFLNIRDPNQPPGLRFTR
ncbi:MAG: FtsQ-type POTRA domain-containing protein [Defluviitaleaceae bacterium]|nr:FtsQ-type POTRA domain-containing protein [Defluviitaleaceae bacterium]